MSMKECHKDAESERVPTLRGSVEVKEESVLGKTILS